MATTMTRLIFREKGDAPDRLGFAAGTEGAQEFGEDQHGEGVGAGGFRGSRLSGHRGKPQTRRPP
jgi:hypothetical protein